MNNLHLKSLDKRVERSKKIVLDTTQTLLSEEGLGGVSVDEVSRRSGVSKTTIYRHWPSRSNLLMEACAKISPRPEMPDTGTLRGDLGALATQLAHFLKSSLWSAVYPSIVDAAERDPEAGHLQGALHAGMTAPFVTAVDRARERGELAEGHETPELIAKIVGPLLYRRWFSKEPLDAQFVKSVVRAAAGGSGLPDAIYNTGS